VCYICDEEKFLFSGDTLFKLTVGRTDLWGGNINELLDSVEKLMLLSDDYEVFTGHNISTTIGSERVRNRYLRKKKICPLCHTENIKKINHKKIKGLLSKADLFLLI
jgi:glyoxylase-like metal-dependent hydrolase (beta-lactamase superfamily II)